MWKIVRYSPEHKDDWNGFVASSRNSSFLFNRDYMDYHADRFRDCSLMAFRKGVLASLLPAHISDGSLFSHNGLTYGGWLLPSAGIDCSDVISLWREWLGWCIRENIHSVFYKPLPYIYSRMPSQEDLYLLFLVGAKQVRSEISSTMILENNPGFNKLQRRHLAHAPADLCIRDFSSIPVEEKPSFLNAFHSLLTDCLNIRHSASPVHSEEELALLASRFPAEIDFTMLFDAEAPSAAICTYLVNDCMHCQYIATSEAGREKNLLPVLFKYLIDKAKNNGIRYFDFGTSNTDGGRKLNAGLNRQKTSFGASATVCQQWQISVADAFRAIS